MIGSSLKHNRLIIRYNLIKFEIFENEENYNLIGGKKDPNYTETGNIYLFNKELCTNKVYKYNYETPIECIVIFKGNAQFPTAKAN